MLSYLSAIVTLLVIAVVVAEPPVRQNARFSKQFQNPDARAFQPILLSPLGGQFVVLQQLQSVPQVANNPPQPERDVPEANDQDQARNATTSTRENDPAASEVERSEKLTNKGDEGVYYIYHPNGLLQKVDYATTDDVEKMAFSARLKYQNVEPIREPIYTYDPETFAFRRV